MTSYTGQRPILIVDDSPEDFEAARHAFRKSGLANPIYHCCDGDDALDFLYRRGTYAANGRAARPGFILLDLNMPGTDGREVLQEVKSDPQLRNIPVIMLTTSSDERDIEACYGAGANSYVRKPDDLMGFFEAIEKLKDYWFEVVLLPKNGEPSCN